MSEQKSAGDIYAALRAAITSVDRDKIAESLLSLPEDKINEILPFDIKEIPNSGKTTRLTPLGLAILINNSSLIKKLVERKVDINKVDASGQNALNFALSIEKYAAAEAIMQNYSPQEKLERFKIKDSFGMSPIDWFGMNLAESIYESDIDFLGEVLFFSQPKEKRIEILNKTKIDDFTLLDMISVQDIKNPNFFQRFSPDDWLGLILQKNEAGISYIERFLEETKDAKEIRGSDASFLHTIYLTLISLPASAASKKEQYIDQLINFDFLNAICKCNFKDEDQIIRKLLKLKSADKLKEILLSFDDTSKSIIMMLIQKRKWSTLNDVLKLLNIPELKTLKVCIDYQLRNMDIKHESAFLAELSLYFPEFEIIGAAKSLIRMKATADDYEKREYWRLRGERESSQDDTITEIANHHFEKVVKPYLNKKFETYGKSTEERIINIEQEIRKMILEHIINNYNNELETAKNKKEESEIKRIQEILEFIESNKEKIISLDKSISEKSHVYFNSNTNIAEIAWRAFDGSFPTTAWPNLFVEPDELQAASPVYTTAASTGGSAINRKMASQIVRERAAFYYLSAIDEHFPEGREDRITDFIQYVAGIRRAHNEDRGDIVGQDNPSCFPGHITRLALIGNKHPTIILPTRKSVRELVEEKVQAIIARTFTDYIKSMSKKNKENLLNALTLFKFDNAEQVIRSPLKEISLDLFKLRDKFMGVLSSNISEIKSEVTKFVKEKLGIQMVPEEYGYLIYALSNLGGGSTARQLYDIYRSQIEPTALTPELELKEKKEERDEKEKKAEAEKIKEVVIENPFIIREAGSFPKTTPQNIIERQIKKDIALHTAFDESIIVLQKTGKFPSSDIQGVAQELIIAYFATDPEFPIKQRVEEALNDLKGNMELVFQIPELEAIKEELASAFERGQEKAKNYEIESRAAKETKNGKDHRDLKEFGETKTPHELQQKFIEDLRRFKESVHDKRLEFFNTIALMEKKYLTEVSPSGLVPGFEVAQARAKEEEEKKAKERGKGAEGPQRQVP